MTNKDQEFSKNVNPLHGHSKGNPLLRTSGSSSTRPLRVAILGASGSIGTQALQIAREHPDKLEVVALSVHTSTEFLVRAAHEFSCKMVCVTDDAHANDSCLESLSQRTKLYTGTEGLIRLIQDDALDCILMAIVGAAAIEPTSVAIKAGKRIALANKEALVVAGDILMPLVKPGQLFPVDSEHSAIFQCLMGEKTPYSTIWLTCSGGPFYGYTRAELKNVNAHDALRHPSWHMGPKITIDSATLANKGLEVIEAHHLFDADYDQIKTLIQPGSTIHSMVTFADGSTKAQLASPSMKVPIALAFSYPERWSVKDERIDYQKHTSLSFDEPDINTFRCLDLAISAGRLGGTMPAVMNAANEVANAAFRAGALDFLGIERIIESTMDYFEVDSASSVEQLLSIDKDARRIAQTFIAN